jgi:hypothetical protein
MTERNKVVREKLNDIDKDLKQKAKNSNHKKFSKLMGMKVEIQDYCPDENGAYTNLLEIKIHLNKSKDSFIKLVYDHITDDFDRKSDSQTIGTFHYSLVSVLEIQPECERYNEILNFLRRSRDIQGLLSTYRASLESKTTTNKQQVQKEDQD